MRSISYMGLGIVFYIICFYGIKWAHPVVEKRYTAYRVEALKKAPDCSGEVIADFKNAQMVLPRTEKIQILLADNNNSNTVLNRADLKYSCDDKLVVIERGGIIWNDFTSKIPRLRLYYKPSDFGKGPEVKEFSGFMNGDFIINKDSHVSVYKNDKWIHVPFKVTHTEYENKVTRINAPSAILFMLPYQDFPTASKTRVTFSCDLNWSKRGDWNNETLFFKKPDKCETVYLSENGVAVHYIVKVDNNLEEDLPKIEREVRGLLSKSFLTE